MQNILPDQIFSPTYSLTELGEPIYNIYHYIYLYNRSNIHSVAKMKIFDNACEIIYNSHKKELLMNTEAFITYMITCSFPYAADIRTWIFEKYKFRQVGRPRTRVNSSLEDFDRSSGALRSVEDVWNDIESNKSEMYNTKRKQFLKFGCQLYGLEFTINSILLLLKHVTARSRWLLNGSPCDSVGLLLQLITKQGLKTKIQQDILDKYEQTIRAQNVTLFALTLPTKAVWKGFVDVLQRQVYGTVPAYLDDHVKIPKLFYSYDTIRKRLKELTSSFDVYRPISIQPNPYHRLGYSLKDNGLQQLLISFWRRNEEHISKYTHYKEQLVPVNVDMNANNMYCVVTIQAPVTISSSWHLLTSYMDAMYQYKHGYHKLTESDYTFAVQEPVIKQTISYNFKRTNFPPSNLTTFQRLFRIIPTLHLILGGDGFKMFRFNEVERRHLMHVSLKIGNLHQDLFSKIANHLLLSIMEGQESHETLKQVFSLIFDQCKLLKRGGVMLNGLYHSVKFSVTGDMKWIWLCLGMSPTSFDGMICWQCDMDTTEKDVDWCKCGNKRLITDICDQLYQRKTNIQALPISDIFETSDYKSGIHHAQLSHLRGFLRACITKAVQIDMEKDELLLALNFQNTPYWSHYLQQGTWSGLPRKCIELVCQQVRQPKNTTVDVLDNITTDGIRAFGRFRQKYTNDELEKNTIEEMNFLLRSNRISLQLSTEENAHLQLIGKMFNPIFNLVSKFGEILKFSNIQVNAAQQLQKCLNIANNVGSSSTKTATKEEKKWFILNVGTIIMNFLRIYDLQYVIFLVTNCYSMYNYVHAMTVHMKDDMIEYGLLVLFSCASFEAINHYIKSIVHRHSNLHRDKKDYLLQVIEYHNIYSYVQQKLFFTKPGKSHRQHAVNLEPSNNIVVAVDEPEFCHVPVGSQAADSIEFDEELISDFTEAD